MCLRRSSTIDSRRPSPGSSATAVAVSSSLNGTTANDDRFALGDDLVGALTAPLRRHVLVLDPLLEQDDPLEQGFRPRWTAGDVDVDGDDLVDALGDRVAVPVRTAAVGAAAHRDHV